MSPYRHLRRILDLAFEQSANGKGKERHNSKGQKTFEQQPIMEIGRMVGPGYPTGQAMKKLQEAVSMMERGDFQKARAEALGAIVYASAFHLLIEEAEARAPIEAGSNPADEKNWNPDELAEILGEGGTAQGELQPGRVAHTKLIDFDALQRTGIVDILTMERIRSWMRSKTLS